jgi:predicted transcriptional regulator
MGQTRRPRRTAARGAADEQTTTTIALDAETHRRLRHLAIEEGTTLRDLIREAIADLLRRRGGK